MDTLPTNMLLCNFNKKLETGVREKFNVDPETPVLIEWAEDGSCICSILVGDVSDTFSYFKYEEVQALLLELFGATDVEQLEECYWPDNSSSLAFKEFKKRVGLTDPEITCGAELPDEHRAAWEATYYQNAVVTIKKESK